MSDSLKRFAGLSLTTQMEMIEITRHCLDTVAEIARGRANDGDAAAVDTLRDLLLSEIRLVTEEAAPGH